MEAVTEGAGGEEDIRGAGAVEDGDTAARAVGGAVVHVHEELLSRVARQDLKDCGGEDAAAGGAVGAVVGDGLGGGVRGDGEVLGAEVGGAEGGGLGPGGARRDAGGGDEVAVDEGGLVDGQVIEGNGLSEPGVGEGREAYGVGAHLIAQVVEAGLPADHVLDVLDDDLYRVGVREVVARRGCSQTVFSRADGHGVGDVVVGSACCHHVEGHRWVLDGPRGQGAGKKQAAGAGDECEKQECRSSDEPQYHRTPPRWVSQSLPDDKAGRTARFWPLICAQLCARADGCQVV